MSTQNLVRVKLWVYKASPPTVTVRGIVQFGRCLLFSWIAVPVCRLAARGLWHVVNIILTASRGLFVGHLSRRFTRSRIISSQQTSIVPEWSVRHLHSTSDSAPVLQYHLHWLRYFTYLHFLHHLYHIPTLWDSGIGLWELAIPCDTTMYLAACNMLYFAVFFVNELQTSGYYHQSPDELTSPTLQSITFLWNSRTS